METAIHICNEDRHCQYALETFVFRENVARVCCIYVLLFFPVHLRRCKNAFRVKGAVRKVMHLQVWLAHAVQGGCGIGIGNAQYTTGSMELDMSLYMYIHMLTHMLVLSPVPCCLLCFGSLPMNYNTTSLKSVLGSRQNSGPMCPRNPATIVAVEDHQLQRMVVPLLYFGQS